MEGEKKSNGALIGLVIIIIILVIGGIYMWQKSLNQDTSNDINLTEESSEPLSEQDASAINALEQEIDSVDANADVDVESVN